MSDVEQRAALAASRVRQGLPVSDDLLSEILGAESSATRAGIYTPEEREDISGDGERMALARAVLGDAEDVLGDVQHCWMDGRRGIRVLLTAEHERYHRRLSERLGAERVLVERAAMNEHDAHRLQESIREQSTELEQQGIFLTRSGTGIGGFKIEYLAWDPVAGEAALRERFGDRVTLRYRGASNHTFSKFPFGSSHAEADKLHVFYGLPHNGERPGSCQAFEDDNAVVVSLTIKDWRGAKTLIAGFTPSHATVELSRPLGDRVVIDDSANRVRPHLTQA